EEESSDRTVCDSASDGKLATKSSNIDSAEVIDTGTSNLRFSKPLVNCSSYLNGGAKIVTKPQNHVSTKSYGLNPLFHTTASHSTQQDTQKTVSGASLGFPSDHIQEAERLSTSKCV
ncbi:unnamed protein product, partial [Protopolystoma xenopodis]